MVKGTFTLTFSGPLDARDALLTALSASSIAAHHVAPAVQEPGADTSGWVAAEFHEGGDNGPSPEFQAAVRARAVAITDVFGYTERSSAVTAAGIAEARDLVDVRTGQVVTKAVGMTTREDVEAFAPYLGIDATYLELREPADLWTPPADAG